MTVPPERQALGANKISGLRPELAADNVEQARVELRLQLWQLMRWSPWVEALGP